LPLPKEYRRTIKSESWRTSRSNRYFSCPSNRSSLPQSELKTWSSHLNSVTTSISDVACKALIRCLPTNSNVHRWSRTHSSACTQCGEQETENHVLNNCSISAGQGRYTWRHNAVVKEIVTYLLLHLGLGEVIYADLHGQLNHTDLCTAIFPDITVVQYSHAYILELKNFYEKNFETSKAYKLDKYKKPSLSSKVHLSFSSAYCRGKQPRLRDFCKPQ